MSDNIEQLKNRITELEQKIVQLKAKDNSIFSFDFLFETIRQPLFILTASYDDTMPIITRVNKSASELIKSEPEDILKQTPVELGIFSSSEQYKKISKGLNSSETYTYLGKIKTNTGQVISSEITIYVFRDTDNIQFLVFQRNIGSHQKVVEALRQSEYRFLQMAENVSEGIIIKENNMSVFINSSMEKITGFTKEQLQDLDEYALAREDETDRVRMFKQKIAELTKGIHEIEYWIKTKTGQEKCIKSNYTFSVRPNGSKTTYIITSDITSRKKIEQALRKSQDDFRMLAENSPDIITRYNRELKYSYVNSTFEKITKIPTSRIIGRNNLELNIDASVVSFIEEMHLEVFRTGKTIKFEFRLPVNEGIKVFQSHLVPELSDDGSVNSVLNVARDITQIKQVEKDLKDEKQHIIEENRLIATNLKKWSNTLCTNKDYIKNTKDENCLNPIIRIADWAQHEYLKESFTSEIIDVNSFIKDFFNDKASYIEKHNLEAIITLPIHNITILSDKNMLTQTLSYLLENAVEATDKGKIEIGYDIYNEKEIVVFIKDTGKGIEPEDTDRIFKPFVTIDKDEHVGLGLSLAMKNVESMKGIVWCLSSPGTGSTFCFTHPAKIEKSLLQAKNDANEPAWAGKKVLVVEDTDANFLLLEAILTQYGVELHRAFTGKEAISMAKANEDYALILMDIQLPGINGFEATKEIRKFNKNVPIIAQTAYAMYDDVVKALDVGCNDFIAKPIKTKKLINLIDKYLSV